MNQSTQTNNENLEFEFLEMEFLSDRTVAEHEEALAHHAAMQAIEAEQEILDRMAEEDFLNHLYEQELIEHDIEEMQFDYREI